MESGVAALLVGGMSYLAPLGGGCTLLVPFDAVVVPATVGASGSVKIGLAIPAQPALLGLEAYAQFAVGSSQGAFHGLACFSEGLRILIGL